LSAQKLNLAVIDDEPEVLRGLRRLLMGRGYCVEVYERGGDFLGALPSQRFDCLLLDLHMPDVDGFEILRILASRSNQVPIVVVSALDSPGIGERVRALGAFTYLRKPVDSEPLLSAIRSAIAAGAPHWQA
jgi:CheY-like chemotaxis protein